MSLPNVYAQSGRLCPEWSFVPRVVVYAQSGRLCPEWSFVPRVVVCAQSGRELTSHYVHLLPGPHFIVHVIQSGLSLIQILSGKIIHTSEKFIRNIKRRI